MKTLKESILSSTNSGKIKVDKDTLIKEFHKFIDKRDAMIGKTDNTPRTFELVINIYYHDKKYYLDIKNLNAVISKKDNNRIARLSTPEKLRVMYGDYMCDHLGTSDKTTTVFVFVEDMNHYTYVDLDPKELVILDENEKVGEIKYKPRL